MRWWEKDIGGRSRGRLIALIRRGVDTVEALAAELEVTDNAVRAQLAILEREGLVERAGVRHVGKVGKPATTYAVAADADGVLSAAHAPVLRALLAALKDRMPGPALETVLRDAGRRLSEDDDDAQGRAEPKKRTPEAGARAAARVLRSLGGEVKIEKTPEGTLLKGFACPLADVVATEPKVCRAVETLVSAVAGAPAHECCDRTGRARCRFLIAPSLSQR